MRVDEQPAVGVRWWPMGDMVTVVPVAGCRSLDKTAARRRNRAERAGRKVEAQRNLAG